MYRAFLCLSAQHDAWVLPLAAIVCWVSSHTALRLARQSSKSRGLEPWAWLLAAGFSAGAGVWSTHFIGMLGYDPGIAVGYDTQLTLLSLMAAILASLIALTFARRATGSAMAASAGIVLGLGVAAMHFIGMASIRLPGAFVWDRPLVVVSILIGCSFSAAAFVAVRHRDLKYPNAVAATLLTAAIAGLHFTAMGAVEIVPDGTGPGSASGLPRPALAFGIAAVMLAILGFAALALFAGRMRRANRALRASEAALRISEERLALALDSGSDGLWDWDVATGKVWFSDRWQTMVGYEPGEIEGHVRSWRRLRHPDDVARARRLLTDHIEGKTPIYECEQRVLTKSGAYTWVLSRGKVVTRDATGAPLRVVGTHIDIAVRKQAEQQIEYLALYDALTGLPNRTLFWDRLDREMVSAERRGHFFAVLACDLDRFKSVNDSMGHPAGDSLLRQIAERLKAAIREGDTVARLGGDEFAIVLRGLDHPQNASTTAQHVIDAVQLPVDLDGRTVSVGISIGIAVGPQDGGNADQLFKNADIALYRAKAAGRSTYRYYEPDMDAVIAERNALELDLREAVRLGEFALFYQPIIDLRNDRLSGFEALMRWRSPTRGLVSPGAFIPLAEEIGLVVPLGAWALKEACREAAGWPGDLRVAVNASTVQFAELGLEYAVVTALAASGLPPHRLELEITESVLMGDTESAIACLHRLRGLGVHIALDDFGTGFSSLSYLRRFPFDKIKIDRSFIHEIGDADTAAIVRAIVGLAERLGANITAEGVEDEIQLAHVRREGFTEAQGYLLSKPLSAPDALQFAFAAKERAA
ncbi:EAL domain-containing protein [Methylobacterium sp. E-045]|uniref:EAL domain-containing protein n=1 Tax=Methylobacterium sp. E-045 TaxID=2836575 RepID=UPI001FBA0384|nr:EAL domain-containing protein [Methylobacterium sp. E-045]MCJ2130781.1 EAL domain-containing protein [Methylobacterium sp. E-045]